MELGLSNTLLAGDPRLIDHIVGEVKSQGIFDQFRKECIADVDTKPAYQNLRTRVEGSVNSFLGKQTWRPDLNKNQLRETLRKHIHDAPYLDAGVERIVDQVVNPKVYSVFMPQIEDVVYKFLGLERPKSKEKNGACGLKDLLPKDLDPVSPESDKNSLKDVSLESVDEVDDFDIDKGRNSTIGQNLQSAEDCDNASKDVNGEADHTFNEAKTAGDACKSLNKSVSNSNINTSAKSDDKTEEDEEDSPTFEPIDIMNLNESNDSHLSGISELTSHRSRSPDFSNELSHDNFDYSNQDSQFSKVSSDSRLSIVTDFGSSNHASTPLQDASKDEGLKDKSDKNVKDNFKAVREFDTSKNKSSRNLFDLNKCKDGLPDFKDSKESKSVRNSLSSKENSRDAIDSASKDKYEHKNYKDKSKDYDASKSKSEKEKNHSKDTKYYKTKEADRKKQSSRNSVKYDKHGKHKPKEKTEQARESSDKSKDVAEPVKDGSTKSKEDKTKETDKKDNTNKEVKDLKDLYKEKIRELREKKELTEKEKLNRDNHEVKVNKDYKEKKDMTKDKKPYKKDHKSSSLKNSVGGHESKTHKGTERSIDVKDKKSDSRDKGKRDERNVIRDTPKDIKSKHSGVFKSDSVDKPEKQEIKKIVKNEKEEKSDTKKEYKASEKVPSKKDVRSPVPNKASDKKSDSKKDTKSDSQSKDKRRKDDKRSKTKDDHASLRKNPSDRRSTDRDGSNGSNSKSSQSSNTSCNTSTSKSGTSNQNKESNNVNNSSSEASDSIDETQITELKLSVNTKPLNEENLDVSEMSNNSDKSTKLNEVNESNLPFKKRPLLSDDRGPALGEVLVKKPKFAKNIHEAKKLMKIRKQMEKQKLKENKKMERKQQQKTEPTIQPSTSIDNNDLERVPDEERVQIIEIPDEEYEEPYPERQTNLTLEERSIIMLESEACANELLRKQFNITPKLADIELSIGQSVAEIIADKICEDNIGQQRKNNKTDAENPQENEDEQGVPSCNVIENVQVLDRSERKDDGERRSVDVALTDDSPKISESPDVPTTSTIQGDKALEIMASGDQNTKCDDEEMEKQQTARVDETIYDSEQLEMSCGTSQPEKLESGPEKGNIFNTCTRSFNKICSLTSNDDSLATESTSAVSEDHEDCRYFKADSDESEKFSNFLESLELVESSTLEDIIESLGGQVVSSMPKAMAPPLLKRKHSSSPLTDILLSNSNNNNDGHKQTANVPNENAMNNIKKRKIVGPKKQRYHANVCGPQGLLNGENFVMPLSPESDVSATSDKLPSSNVVKEEKSRHRSSQQRYSSDDLYKPRPLFSSSSRRSRRSNQA